MSPKGGAWPDFMQTATNSDATVSEGQTTMDQCFIGPSRPGNGTSYGLTVKLAPDRQGAFHGAFATERVGSATVFEGQAAFDAAPRSSDSIARLPFDSLCIYQHLRGIAWYPAGPGKEQSDFIVATGALTTDGLDLLRLRPPADAQAQLRVVRIPLTLCHGLLNGADDLSARPLCTGEGVGTLFRVYFHAFLSQSRHLDPAAADAAVRTLARLALLARGDAAMRADDSPHAAARRPARLDGLHRFIDENLCRSELTPSFAAKALGVSVRQVHLLFAPSGTTFARHVTARRLELVRMHLLHGGKRSVADIAFSSGFDNLSTFYRTFRNAFGISPGELRENGSAQAMPPVDL